MQQARLRPSILLSPSFDQDLRRAIDASNRMKKNSSPTEDPRSRYFEQPPPPPPSSPVAGFSAASFKWELERQNSR